MSSDNAFWNQFEKLVNDHGMTLNEFREKFTTEGDGFRERFEEICGVLLIDSPKDKKEQKEHS